jgi:riboflavin synthase
MFSGIIESTGKVVSLRREGSNLHIEVECGFADELKPDQSISHNGVCLTVTEINGKNYFVTAIDETLKRTNLGSLTKGDTINLERCVKAGDRLDGHIVQGHVDTTATVENILLEKGSWLFYFSHKNSPSNLTVEKGSVCINGVSLTVVDSTDNSFSVAIIPYTFEHTNFNRSKKGDIVNVEFDIIGKYVARLLNKN